MKGYLEASEPLLAQAGEELAKENVGQVAENVWSAAALAVKSHAVHREGRRLTSHGELWEYVEKMID